MPKKNEHVNARSTELSEKPPDFAAKDVILGCFRCFSATLMIRLESLNLEFSDGMMLKQLVCSTVISG